MAGKSKLEVIMITRNFPPLIGGMERLNYHIYKYFQATANVHFLGPVGSDKFIDSSTSYKTFPIKPIWLYMAVSFFKAISSGFKKKDVIFCGSGATALAGYFLSKLVSSKLIIYLHGLDIVARSKLYQWIFIPCIKRANRVIVNSQYTKSLAMSIGIQESKISILNPGIDLPDFENLEFKKDRLISFYQLYKKKIILILGRITRRKGIVEFIENVMPGLIEKDRDIHLLIVGSEAVNAINHCGNVTRKIIEVINKNKLNDSVTLVGNIDDYMLGGAYFAADLMIFPVLNLPDDVEGFGMVALEAAAHGVKTVAFNTGGVADAIKDGESGFLVESNNYSKFSEVILKNLCQFKKPDESAVMFAKEYRWSEFNKKLEKIIEETICGEG